MIILTKVLSIVLGLVVIAKTIHDYKKGNESIIMLSFWSITWVTVVVLACFPFLIEKANTFIGGDNGNGVNTFIGAAFIFVLFVTYRIYAKANRLERQIHDMVMKIGIKDITEQE